MLLFLRCETPHVTEFAPFVHSGELFAQYPTSSTHLHHLYRPEVTSASPVSIVIERSQKTDRDKDKTLNYCSFIFYKTMSCLNVTVLFVSVFQQDWI